MEPTKAWYRSRTIWAALVTIGATLAGGFGLATEDADVELLVEGILQTVAAAGGLVAILGRLAARARIE